MAAYLLRVYYWCFENTDSDCRVCNSESYSNVQSFLVELGLPRCWQLSTFYPGCRLFSFLLLVFYPETSRENKCPFILKHPVSFSPLSLSIVWVVLFILRQDQTVLWQITLHLEAFWFDDWHFTSLTLIRTRLIYNGVSTN